MTKKLLLAAGAVAALAFAGAANAGSIAKTSTISGIALDTGTAYGPLTIASEATDPTPTAAMATAAGGVSIVNTLATAASVADGATNVYEVIFTPAGGSFDGATQSIAVTATGVGTPTYTQLGKRSDGTVAALVSVTGNSANGTAGSVTAFTLTTGLKATSEANITVAASVNLIANGVRIAVDSTEATTVARWSPLLKTAALVATAASPTAALPNYTSFLTTNTTANLATAIKLEANTNATGAGGKFYNTLGAGAAEATIANVVTGGTLTVTADAGGQLNKLQPKIDAVTPATATLTDTTAIFTIGDGSSVEGAGATLSLTQPSTAVPMSAASYKVAFLPTFATGFTAPTVAYGPIAAGSVSLEGTNFNAPWFTLNNANNSATLRLANNGTTATGPVFATLKANNGSAAATTTRVTLTNSLAAGQVFEITGAQMATLFGTNAQNGDLQITVQGDGTVISGKVRVRNVSGATFESSLGNLK